MVALIPWIRDRPHTNHRLYLSFPGHRTWLTIRILAKLSNESCHVGEWLSVKSQSRRHLWLTPRSASSSLSRLTKLSSIRPRDRPVLSNPCSLITTSGFIENTNLALLICMKVHIVRVLILWPSMFTAHGLVRLAPCLHASPQIDTEISLDTSELAA